MSIRITPTGTVQFMYHDALRPLLTAGEGHIRRASQVEPTPEGHWTADLSPMQGPILGPYLTRADALTAEAEWLTQNWLRRPQGQYAGPGERAHLLRPHLNTTPLS